MSRFANCPGEDCKSKVKIWPAEGMEEINFCCVPCFQYTWARLVDVDMEHWVPHEHSGQCRIRQMSRINEPVVEGEYRIHTPKITPPSRLGGNGGPTVS